jgi:hypothetical protein
MVLRTKRFFGLGRKWMHREFRVMLKIQMRK